MLCHNDLYDLTLCLVPCAMENDVLVIDES